MHAAESEYQLRGTRFCLSTKRALEKNEPFDFVSKTGFLSDKGVFSEKKVLTTFGFSKGEEEDKVSVSLSPYRTFVPF